MKSKEPTSGDTEKMYNGVMDIFEILQKRFMSYDKANADDDTSSTLDYLTKLSGSIGYTAQVHSGLAKAYQHEKRLSDIEKKLSKLPPELLKTVINDGR